PVPLATRTLVIGRRPASVPERAQGPIGSVPSRAGDAAIVLTSGYASGSRSVLVAFPRDASRPSTGVKVGTSVTTAEGTRLEHERLTNLRRVLDPGRAGALPVAIDLVDVLGVPASVQSCADGPRMDAGSGRARSGRRNASRQLD